MQVVEQAWSYPDFVATLGLEQGGVHHAEDTIAVSYG